MEQFIYDQRILSWKGLEKVSILTLKGRQVIPIVLGEYQQTKLVYPRRGQVNLLYQNGTFILYQCGMFLKHLLWH